MSLYLDPVKHQRVTPVGSDVEVSTTPDGWSTVAFGPNGQQVDFGSQDHDAACAWISRNLDRLPFMPHYTFVGDVSDDRDLRDIANN